MRRAALILMVALIQSVMVLWGLIAQARLIASGTEVVLAAEARDPRDLLRGHYARLRLAISDLPADLPLALPSGETSGETSGKTSDGPPAGPAARPLPGAPVWVTLARGADGVWQASALATTDPDGVAIRGTYMGDYGATQGVDFDIARYYAPKDRALALEQAMRDGAVAVILALSPDGRAVLRGVVIHGVRHLQRLF